MNFNVDVGKLSGLFQSAPSCTPAEAASFQGEVNQYLLEHFLLPFINDENPPTVGSIDFSAFDLEDAEEFEAYLEASGSTSAKLMRFYQTFCASRPLSVARRAFC